MTKFVHLISTLLNVLFRLFIYIFFTTLISCGKQLIVLFTDSVLSSIPTILITPFELRVFVLTMSEFHGGVFYINNVSPFIIEMSPLWYWITSFIVLIITLYSDSA